MPRRNNNPAIQPLDTDRLTRDLSAVKQTYAAIPRPLVAHDGLADWEVDLLHNTSV